MEEINTTYKSNITAKANNKKTGGKYLQLIDKGFISHIKCLSNSIRKRNQLIRKMRMKRIGM